MPPREWNAASYDRMSDPQLAMARDVMDRLDLRGDERVLDAGCGTGRVTEELLARVPNGTLIAVDGSQAMVDQTRERLGDRVEAFAVDLVELEVTQPFDAILSTATFHWIADHERLFARLHTSLRPGGRLVAQCGGAGNVASVGDALRKLIALEPFAQHFEGFGGMWTFASDSETAERLKRLGFERVKCWLEPKAVRPEHPYEYMRAVTLGPHLARLPEALHPRFVEAVLERMGEPLELDYVRLNIEAARPR